MKLELKSSNLMKSSEYHQFFLGIISYYSDYILEVYNKQIGFGYNRITKRITPLTINEYNYLLGSCLNVEGIVLGKSWDVVGKEYIYDLPDLIGKKIKENFYVRCTGDVYYIKSKPEYNKLHAWQDIYIIGYENNHFIAIGCTNNSNFEEYLLSKEELIESVKKRENLSIYNNYSYNFELDFYKLKENLEFRISNEQIKQRLLKYLSPQKNKSYWIGIDAYEGIFENWLECGIVNIEIQYILDHCSLMRDRIKYISNINKSVQRSSELYNSLYLKMKYIISFLTDKKINQKDFIQEMKSIIFEEKKILEGLLNLL